MFFTLSLAAAFSRGKFQKDDGTYPDTDPHVRQIKGRVTDFFSVLADHKEIKKINHMTPEETIYQVSQYSSHDHADGDLTEPAGKGKVVPEIIESEKRKNTHTAQNKVFSVKETPGCPCIAPVDYREKTGYDLTAGIERNRVADDHFCKLIQQQNDSHQQKHSLRRCPVYLKFRFWIFFA